MAVDESQFLGTMSGYFKPRHNWRDATGRGVVVAIVDSGVETTHPELVGKVVESVEARVEGTRVVFDPSVAGDSAGHGTACAGIISRIAPDAKFASIKVLGAGGLGDGQGEVVATDRGGRGLPVGARNPARGDGRPTPLPRCYRHNT